MATIADKFSKVSTGVRPLTTTVDGTRATSGATLSCADLTGWDTDKAVHGVTYKLDGQGAIIAGSQLDFKGVVSGNTITNFTVTGGTDAGNAVGDIVQATPTAAWAKDLADGILTSLDDDGTLKAGAVDNAAALASNVVTTAKILDANVTTAKIANANVTPSKLATGAATAVVNTGETTTSTSFADLATTTDSVTVDIGANGLALVSMRAQFRNNTAPSTTLLAVDVSGANTIAADDARALQFQAYTANAQMGFGDTQLFTGLTPGSTTFKLKYRVTGGTATYYNRRISVVPL